ncbi:glycosyl hydrolase family 18 protein [Clostridium sp.]|uniref:glycosyl hydrolase family 18 protein n=1 Tax=Clostridium sp. TaxID=1506 RepID=UPI00283C7E05|nr:glycosyl hydrolase family 18 protein [Clostridium sp.]MDR3596005.1 glycosyl hydrolase family 18 protein [Clostridium sp.]
MLKSKIMSCLVLTVFAVSLVVGVVPATVAKAATTQKNVVTYYPNWATYSSAHQSMNPNDIPWTKVNVVNHAFFTVDSSFKIASLDTYADFQKQMAHSGDWTQTLKGCFGEYQYYKGLYPDKKIIVSVGGWTRGENFHAMAMTAATRKVFTDSVVAFLKQYPFIDGIDIDWEYPGIDRQADPNDQYDHGCPGGPEDKVNYTLLLQDIRAAYNSNGLSDKMLTVAAAAGYDKMNLVQPDQYAQYVDFMNVMTYDMHGAFENVTNHQSPLYANPADPSPTSPIDIKNKYNADYAIKAYRDIYGIPASKLNVGTPLYSRGWTGVQPGPNGDGLYQTSTGAYTGSLDNPQAPGGQESWFNLKKLETTPGWKKYYDNVASAVYLYNASTGVFLSYEDEKTLQAKCDYVNNNNLGGIIIWDASTDDISNGCPMTTIAWNNMTGPVSNTLQAATLSASAVNNGAYALTATVPANNTATSYQVMEGTTQVATGTLVAGQTTTQTVTYNVTGKSAGTYNYTVVVNDTTSSATSSQVSVTVSAPVSNTLQAATLSASAVNNGAYTLTATVPANNTATSYKVMEGTTQVATGTLIAGQATTQTVTYNATGKSAGTYNYTVVVNDATSSATSNQVSVTVPTVAANLPGKPILAQDNWNGSSTYQIIMNMWWGENGTSWKLYENGVLVSTKTLTANGQNAQTDSVSFTGKAKGTYVYKAELINDSGSTFSDNYTYTVTN